MPERARLADDLGREAVPADGAHDIGAGALDGERAGAHALAGLARDRLGLPGEDRLVEPQLVGLDESPVGKPSRTGIARGATSRARRSRACLARISWEMPIVVLTTITPRNSASRQSPTASVTAPKTARIRLKTVRTFARTMLR